MESSIRDNAQLPGSGEKIPVVQNQVNEQSLFESPLLNNSPSESVSGKKSRSPRPVTLVDNTELAGRVSELSKYAVGSNVAGSHIVAGTETLEDNEDAVGLAQLIGNSGGIVFCAIIYGIARFLTQRKRKEIASIKEAAALNQSSSLLEADAATQAENQKAEDIKVRNPWYRVAKTLCAVGTLMGTIVADFFSPVLPKAGRDVTYLIVCNLTAFAVGLFAVPYYIIKTYCFDFAPQNERNGELGSDPWSKGTRATTALAEQVGKTTNHINAKSSAIAGLIGFFATLIIVPIVNWWGSKKVVNANGELVTVKPLHTTPAEYRGNFLRAGLLIGAAIFSSIAFFMNFAGLIPGAPLVVMAVAGGIGGVLGGVGLGVLGRRINRFFHGDKDSDNSWDYAARATYYPAASIGALVGFFIPIPGATLVCTALFGVAGWFFGMVIPSLARKITPDEKEAKALTLPWTQRIGTGGGLGALIGSTIGLILGLFAGGPFGAILGATGGGAIGGLLGTAMGALYDRKTRYILRKGFCMLFKLKLPPPFENPVTPSPSKVNKKANEQADIKQSEPELLSRDDAGSVVVASPKNSQITPPPQTPEPVINNSLDSPRSRASGLTANTPVFQPPATVIPAETNADSVAVTSPKSSQVTPSPQTPESATNNSLNNLRSRASSLAASAGDDAGSAAAASSSPRKFLFAPPPSELHEPPADPLNVRGNRNSRLTDNPPVISKGDETNASSVVTVTNSPPKRPEHVAEIYKTKADSVVNSTSQEKLVVSPPPRLVVDSPDTSPRSLTELNAVLEGASSSGVGVILNAGKNVNEPELKRDGSPGASRDSTPSPLVPGPSRRSSSGKIFEILQQPPNARHERANSSPPVSPQPESQSPSQHGRKFSDATSYNRSSNIFSLLPQQAIRINQPDNTAPLPSPSSPKRAISPSQVR